jgi:hypothetical protein
MSASLPPPPEGGEFTAEQLREAIKALEAMTFAKELEPAVRITIRALKILVETPGLLALAPLARRLRASLQGRTP